MTTSLIAFDSEAGSDFTCNICHCPVLRGQDALSHDGDGKKHPFHRECLTHWGEFRYERNLPTLCPGGCNTLLDDSFWEMLSFWGKAKVEMKAAVREERGTMPFVRKISQCVFVLGLAGLFFYATYPMIDE